jgi:hypothetical protein
MRNYRLPPWRLPSITTLAHSAADNLNFFQRTRTPTNHATETTNE